MTQQELFEKWIPYRMSSVQLGQIVVKHLINGIDLRKQSLRVYFDDELKFTGIGVAFTNMAIESSLVHGRALLEFMGLKIDNASGTVKEINPNSRRPDDVGIEMLSDSNGPLPFVTLADLSRRWHGDQAQMHRAFQSFITVTNKALMHFTSNEEKVDYIQLDIVLSEIKALVVSHVYTPLELPAPELSIKELSQSEKLENLPLTLGNIITQGAVLLNQEYRQMNVTEILQSAKALTPMERMELVDMILGSVSANDAEVDTAWAQEAERRVQRIDSGEMALTSVQEVLANYKHKPA